MWLSKVPHSGMSEGGDQRAGAAFKWFPGRPSALRRIDKEARTKIQNGKIEARVAKTAKLLPFDGATMAL